MRSDCARISSKWRSIRSCSIVASANATAPIGPSLNPMAVGSPFAVLRMLRGWYAARLRVAISIGATERMLSPLRAIDSPDRIDP